MKGFNGLPMVFLALLFAGSTIAHPQRRCVKSNSTTPTVDLGYEIHQGSVNSTGDYYVFSNIPYAQQPIGDLRFRKPVPITKKSSKVNAGAQDVECYQAYPEWVLQQATSEAAVVETVQTESCLVLDVYVPTDIFKKGKFAHAPVLVWIHGGGYTLGSKTSSGNPAGLLARSKAGGKEGLIVVTINYRLGMFGWLGGDDVTPNLGLYDQRFALEWVQRYISRFGGGPHRVTVMGQSAGASSIVHQITAYGGAKPVPFQAAITQSTAWQFNIDTAPPYQSTLNTASKLTGTPVTDIATLRTLNSSVLASVNQAVVYPAITGEFNFGPAPDGDFVPKLAQVLFYEGKFAHDVNLLISHVSNESVPFTSPDIQTSTDFNTRVSGAFPGASNATINTLLTEIYPDVLDGSHPWETEFARAVQLTTDAFFSCTTTFMAAAKGNATHNYLFEYPPGYHGEDVAYVFFNGDTTTLDDGLPVNAELATALQDYIVAFAYTGDPNTPALPEFPEYGDKSTVLKFSELGITTQVDDEKNIRCAWWQQAIVDGLV
ncbi:carboxylesterase [Xylariaceae sp. FL1651]|nr:carboxylesterase [Xylariaceae sp. FL1651]